MTGTLRDSRSPADPTTDADPAREELSDRGAVRPRRGRRAGWGVAGAAAVAVGYVPAARVPIIADDFQALQETFAVSDGNLWRAISFGVEAGQLGGHFNPVGQALGAAYHFTAYWASAVLGLSPQYFDVLAYLALILLTVAGATSAVVWGASRSSLGRPAFWPLFALICGITAATLQIHAPWSNDPVVSYGPAGWGSAAIGFWTIALALRATAPGARGKGSIIACSALAIGCVWYYEMLVSAVAATALALVLIATVAADRATARRRCLVLLVTAVLLPAVLFVLGRRFALPSGSGSYGGTTVTVGPAALETWLYGMVGALPGGGWNFLAEMSGPPLVRVSTLILAGALCLLLVGTGVTWWRAQAQPAVVSAVGASAARRSTIILVAPLLVFWALATASHSVTLKYIEEIRSPGQVYLFYAVGVVAVAALIAVLLTHLVRRMPTPVLAGLLPLAGIFVLVQVASNMSVADSVLRQYDQNGPLVALSTDGDADLDVRCAVLEAWSVRPWPEYYRTAVTEDVQENYERMFGEPFCSSFESGSP
jgi:hypothetical protein